LRGALKTGEPSLLPPVTPRPDNDTGWHGKRRTVIESALQQRHDPAIIFSKAINAPASSVSPAIQHRFRRALPVGTAQGTVAMRFSVDVNGPRFFEHLGEQRPTAHPALPSPPKASTTQALMLVPRPDRSARRVRSAVALGRLMAFFSVRAAITGSSMTSL
jgi:hypothetical protein